MTFLHWQLLSLEALEDDFPESAISDRNMCLLESSASQLGPSLRLQLLDAIIILIYQI